ncbi:CubicO group peptidase, beta-lactamase class C family [Geodermatophilus dictyosporus]|uniref:CubicO group peptidase, beta-lactamase class C family n=1 Tax=Geodermatophilus dictyosporus TaxID=1523247 RepID=A0A1I5MPN5_9ACTN|nr:serine hydrolase domain-containing protein [Geodermatophilus dictyosporus]SFP11584.1 CubicO group peptidase, beta-lactamase class C family [Geodermatophilus dictyosporus]
MSSGLALDTDPAEVGLDPARLQRLDRRLARWVDDGQLPGFLVTVSRRGRLAHVGRAGMRDVESGLPVEEDTRWRIFSMTKPVTSVAAMMLYEEGAFELTDPIARWLPEFAETRVYVAGSAQKPVTQPQVEPIRIRHLLTHTSGLTYGFHHAHPVDAVYRAMGHEWGTPPGADSAEVCRQWASVPLVFQPGSEWNYGVSTDVLGRLVEVVSGQTLDVFFQERVFGPLGMTGTSFGLREDDDPASLARLYAAVPGQPGGAATGFAPLDTMGAAALSKPAFLSGGGGLVGTAADYVRFAEMLRRGGSFDGGRLLGPRTIAHMTRNHLPGGADLETFGRPLFAETPLRGVGFGLGFSMVIDPVRYGGVASVGDYSWGGAASTAFYVDPVEDVVVTFFTQLLPSSTLPIRAYLRALVNQAIVA